MKLTQRGVIAACILISIVSAVAAQQAQRKAPRISTRIGQFQLYTDTLDFTYKGTSFTADCRAQTGAKVTIKSSRYDLSAPRILLAYGGKAAQVQNAQATGGVVGEARNPERQQVITFSANRADYKTATGEAPAHIDLTGNMRMVIRTPQFADSEPLEIIGESGSLIFQPDGSLSGRLTKARATGTPLEPEPTKKP